MNTFQWTSKFLTLTILILRQFSHTSFKHRFDFQGLWIFHYLEKKVIINVPGFNVRGSVKSGASFFLVDAPVSLSSESVSFETMTQCAYPH